MASNTFTRDFETFGQTIEIEQSTEGHHGCVVWDAAMVLAKYFENVEDFPPNFFRGKRVLELGAGTGLVSIVLQLLGADVTTTELFDDVISILDRNIAKNTSGKRIKSAALRWGEDLSPLSPPFDVIVAADILYEREHFDDLISTLISASHTDGSTLILFSFEVRDKGEAEFLARVKKAGFKVAQIPNTRLDEVFRAEEIIVCKLQSPQASSSK